MNTKLILILGIVLFCLNFSCKKPAAQEIISVTQMYTVTISTGANGTMRPPSMQVASGGSATFNFSPNTGFHTDSLWIDGIFTQSLAGANSYTLDNVTKNHAIKVSFTANPIVTRTSGPPNIIFILADDMGYEMPTFTGGQSYNTTHLDSLAANAMVFNQCRATPLCSPSRVELLSGLYNFRNYLTTGWGSYDRDYITYAKVLQNNGYKTCVVGKWQLNGGAVGIQEMGFDNFCVWNANQVSSGSVYRSPALTDEMGNLPFTTVNNKYSEDITGDYAMNFIDQNRDKPFFIYYSFLLVHEPDQPTPLDGDFLSFDDNLSDTTYIGSMTHYLDLKVGALISKLKADGLDKNTIIVFTGDNGSQGNFHSLFKGQEIKGEKGECTELGTHVPMFVYWPGHIMPGTNSNLVDFSDFAPSFLDMANITAKPPGLDGVSFYPALFGQNGTARSWTYCYYDPFPLVEPEGNPQSQPISFAQDTAYKLYKTGWKSGKFYHFTTDLEERSPLKDSQLTPAQVAVKQKLQSALNGLQ